MLNWEKRGSGRVIEKEMKFRFGMFLNPFWGPFQGISGDIRRCRKWSKQGEGQRTSLVGLIDRPSFVPGSWSASSVFFPSHRYPLSHEGSYLSTRSAYCRSLSFCPCTLRERKIWLVKGLMKTSILIFSILISSWITAKGEGEKLVLTDHPIACDENSYRFASELPTKPFFSPRRELS